jgi:hypothetical protein
MSGFFWFALGGLAGTCITGLAMARAYGRLLDLLKGQIAEHDHITTSLIERLKATEAEHADLIDGIERRDEA